MKAVFLLALCGSLTLADEFTVGGKKVSGEVKRADPDALVVETESGIVRVPLASLSLELQARYGYDAAKASAFAAASAQSAAAKAAADNAAVARERAAKELAALIPKIRATGREADLRVTQVLDDGVLATGAIAGADGTLYRSREPVFIFCKTAGHADGDNFSQTIYEVGTRQYTAVTGARKTVRSYALTPEIAVSEMLKIAAAKR